ncbi:glutathione peroxidase [Pseudoalteromonas fenneropenaei]|uniref:Glutathione peroxidase n=1 Tax=Pseudoalteromonas fenneropenaei TaxID=1737459 RepID=A0ABV7CKF4_9GAMM
MFRFATIGICSALLSVSLFATGSECDDFTNVSLRKLHSKESINLCEFKDKPLLIVNTASNCGFTGQFKGLEQLYQDYKDKGLVVIGFPSDDFFQEEEDEANTAKVCFMNYGVTFPMMATTAVRGSDANDVFKHLNAATSSPNWNFYKYLVSADRKTIERFNSKTTPESDELRQAIEKQLK